VNEEEQQYEDDHKDDNEVESKHKNNDDEAYDDKDAESYNNNKFHHIKVKLHGPGKSPKEWAIQEEKELSEMPVGIVADDLNSFDTVR